MPIKKAASKHLRQTKKLTAKNTAVKNKLKAAVKAARKAMAGKDKGKASLDKTAQNKVIKKNKASRLKSRLTKQLNKLS